VQIDPKAADAALAHLARLDAAVPGLVTGLHVIGSAVLDDYRPGISDLDLVATVGHEVGVTEMTAIADAHRVNGGIEVSTIYLPPGSLAGPPNAVTSAPWVRDGEPHLEPADELHAVTWLELAVYSVHMRGDGVTMFPDISAAQEFCRVNLREYWLPLLDASEAVLDSRSPDVVPNAAGVIHIGLGPTRLWHTIRTGEIVSKSRAGELAAKCWPDLAEHLAEIVMVRNGKHATLTAAHGRSAIELGRRILAPDQLD
jgi:streptomycin 3"-adenylyltransferase